MTFGYFWQTELSASVEKSSSPQVKELALVSLGRLWLAPPCQRGRSCLKLAQTSGLRASLNRRQTLYIALNLRRGRKVTASSTSIPFEYP